MLRCLKPRLDRLIRPGGPLLGRKCRGSILESDIFRGQFAGRRAGTEQFFSKVKGVCCDQLRRLGRGVERVA
jgi:hypothetical protein